MSLTLGGLTFRWSDDQLVVTTSIGQYRLNASETAQLLDFLYTQKDEVFDAETHLDGLASWARQHSVQQFVIGSLNTQSAEPEAPPAPLSLDEGRARRRRNEVAHE